MTGLDQVRYGEFWPQYSEMLKYMLKLRYVNSFSDISRFSPMCKNNNILKPLLEDSQGAHIWASSSQRYTDVNDLYTIVVAVYIA